MSIDIAYFDSEFTMNYFINIYIIPNTSRIKPPIKVDIFPYFSFNIFPKFKPKYVKDRLVIKNINDDNRYFSVIPPNPIPVVRLSILTDKPNNK